MGLNVHNTCSRFGTQCMRLCLEIHCLSGLRHSGILPRAANTMATATFTSQASARQPWSTKLPSRSTRAALERLNFRSGSQSNRNGVWPRYSNHSPNRRSPFYFFIFLFFSQLRFTCTGRSSTVVPVLVLYFPSQRAAARLPSGCPCRSPCGRRLAMQGTPPPCAPRVWGGGHGDGDAAAWWAVT